MAEFAFWLRAQANPDPDTVALRAFADPRADWPWWTNCLSDYVAAIQTANPANKDKLISTVSVNHGLWQAEQMKSEGILPTISNHLGAILLALFGVVVAVAIFYGLFFNQDFFKQMAKVDQARGLITFLFAFSTIAIMLLVAITTYWMPKDEVQARFDKAKDLLTILIGVLGTILGFYFGTLASDQQAARQMSGAQSATPGAPVNAPTPPSAGSQSGSGGASQ
jgi:hypothetical protein